MILDLVDSTHPILKQSLENFNFDIPPYDPLDLVSDMAETMIHHRGIGLAANQVDIPYRVIIVMADELIPMFNPKIVDSSDEQIVLEEGCLSFPRLFVKIKRPRKVRVRYADPTGKVQTEVFDGIVARAIQHEIDHIDGKCHLSRANRIHKDQAINRMNRYRNTHSR